MKGPLSRGQRPGTGSRGGCHGASIGRSSGGCPATEARAILRPVGHPQVDYELSRPVASEEEETDSSRLQGLEYQVKGESDGGTGEIGFRPGGLMQDPVLLQRMAVQQREKRQQTVLGGCGEEAVSICWVLGGCPDGAGQQKWRGNCARSCQ